MHIQSTIRLNFDHGLTHNQLYIVGDEITLEADVLNTQPNKTRPVSLVVGSEITLLRITVPYHRYVFRVKPPLGKEEIIEVYSRRLPEVLTVEE